MTFDKDNNVTLSPEEYKIFTEQKSLRDEFAMAALAGIWAAATRFADFDEKGELIQSTMKHDRETYALQAYKQADAMMKARDKKQD